VGVTSLLARPRPPRGRGFARGRRARASTRQANDPGLYDDLADEWWRPRGAFQPLHWLAAARAELVPSTSAHAAVLVDLACGGGLLAPHVAGQGYLHVGVDVGARAVCVARAHGVTVARGDVLRVPLRDGCADVVVAGEIFEHVDDLAGLIAEIARILRPGGTLVFDTLADTLVCRVLMVRLAERVGIVPRGIHDPALLVDPARLTAVCAAQGVPVTLRGLRPSLPQAVAWAVRLRPSVTMRPTRSTRVVYQGHGVRSPA
jgi:2-polyprenyl-6-hydroxyphenyl methylase / 3-demethylubiquinone-9 3-methyltransferase